MMHFFLILKLFCYHTCRSLKCQEFDFISRIIFITEYMLEDKTTKKRIIPCHIISSYCCAWRRRGDTRDRGVIYATVRNAFLH